MNGLAPGGSEARGRVLLLCFGIFFGVGPVAWADEQDPHRERETLGVTGQASAELGEAVVPPVEAAPMAMDRLLKLPSGWGGEAQKRLGLTELQWRERFERSAREIVEAEQAIASARGELDAMVGGPGGGQWQVAPPGATNTEVTPLSFKHREQIRKGKERLEKAHRDRRTLAIEADLAGVPASWRGSWDPRNRISDSSP